MMYNENLHEEEQHLIQQIAEQTERGKIDWELTEYNPLSFLNEDKIDKNPAVICQSFSFEAIIGGSRYELDVMEDIDVPSGMGDYTITLTRDETENYLKIEDALSFDCDRYECTPEEVAERFADSPIVRLCNAIIPATLGQEDLEEVFTWARFFNETGISAKLMNHPLTKLCEKLFDEHRLMDFHRCVLDVDYRKLLLNHQDLGPLLHRPVEDPHLFADVGPPPADQRPGRSVHPDNHRHGAGGLAEHLPPSRPQAPVDHPGHSGFPPDAVHIDHVDQLRAVPPHLSVLQNQQRQAHRQQKQDQR